MLTSLHVEGFRGFRSLTIPRLARVNLFVGLNNAGKTSVLDAVEMLLGRGDWWIFRDQARRRDEMLLHNDGLAESEVRHLFHGHEASSGASFVVEGNVEELLPERVEVGVATVRASEKSDEALALSVSSSKGSRRRPLSVFRGMKTFPSSSAARAAQQSPLLFLGTEGSTSRELGRLWDRVVLTPEETRVVDALRLIEPGIERIAYTRQEGTTREAFFVKLAGSDERVPLGSMGDGSKRLLALSLHLARAAGGSLLIDEIDAGLHYSAMVRMWHLVIETARRLDVQIFATTHSLDCILAIAELCEQSPALAGDVLLHRVERDATEAVTYTADALRVAAEQQMEVRGHAAEAE